ncbi:MAG TPA: LPS export ABC transporter periplasmic protein LptC [Terriglobia bacterium]|nr:LPS export ABC transporter periplasmic protein LptC [Terriglobia bacterium]
MSLERIFIHRLIQMLRVGVPVLVAALVAIPAWNYLSRREEKKAPRQVQHLPQDASVFTRDITYSQTEGGRTLFTIHAKSNLGFKDSKNMLQDVDVTVFGKTETEPARRIQSKNCSVDQQSNDIQCNGDVRFQLNDKTRGRTEELTYNHRDHMVASPVETTLEQPGSATARANNFEYALDTGLLKLTGDVKVHNANATSLEGGSAVFNQKENWATVSGGVFVKSPTAWIRGESGRADLMEESFNPKTIVVEGGVTAESQSEQSQNTWKMRAEWVEASMSPAGNVERVKARRNVQVENLAADKRQQVTGGEIDAVMDASGKVNLLETRQDARMILGSDRTLRSTTIWSNIEGSVETAENSVLQLADTVIEGGKFKIQQGDIVTFSTSERANMRSGERETRADRTDARFDSRTNSLVELVQSGNFQFRDAQFQGRAQNARFEEGGTVATLDGSPVVTNAQMRMEAGQIRLSQKDNSFSAARNVKTVTKDAAEPVLVTSSRAQGTGDTIVYTENVHLWRGNTTNIKAQRLEISTKDNRFKADGKVESKFEAIRASSDKLDYDDSRGEAHYTGNVHAKKQDVTLASNDMRVKLSEATKDVEEIVGTGGVVVTRGEQHGKGDRAVYNAQTDIVTLTGKPAEVRDKEHGSAQGDRLTMKKTSDTMAVEGENGGRAVTRHPVTK